MSTAETMLITSNGNGKKIKTTTLNFLSNSILNSAKIKSKNSKKKIIAQKNQITKSYLDVAGRKTLASNRNKISREVRVSY